MVTLVADELNRRVVMYVYFGNWIRITERKLPRPNHALVTAENAERGTIEMETETKMEMEMDPLAAP